ncbi:MAG: prepilin-type N-terminal cleavage/methylation domain-containing protein [Thermodesulfobacteriota bacterium]
MKDYIKRLVQKKEGFTLVELLIVIAIIAILAAIAIPQFTKYKNKAYDSELSADAKNAYTAAVAYLTDFPNATIADQSQLSAGGYARSANVVWNAGTMTTTSGSFKLVSTAAIDTKNAAVIIFNGNINIQAAP